MNDRVTQRSTTGPKFSTGPANSEPSVEDHPRLDVLILHGAGNEAYGVGSGTAAPKMSLLPNVGSQAASTSGGSMEVP